jgi:hypothetical protein
MSLFHPKRQIVDILITVRVAKLKVSLPSDLVSHECYIAFCSILQLKLQDLNHNSIL